jgi:hypothetical protein
MWEINNQKVQCPNCAELLLRVVAERDDTNITIYWYHQYENFCLDVFEIAYYEANKLNQYFITLQELLKIEL